MNQPTTEIPSLQNSNTLEALLLLLHQCQLHTTEKDVPPPPPSVCVGRCVGLRVALRLFGNGTERSGQSTRCRVRPQLKTTALLAISLWNDRLVRETIVIRAATARSVAARELQLSRSSQYRRTASSFVSSLYGGLGRRFPCAVKSGCFRRFLFRGDCFGGGRK